MSRFTDADPSMCWLVDQLHKEGVLGAGQADRIEGAVLSQRHENLARQRRVDALASGIDALKTGRWGKALAAMRGLRVKLALWRLGRRARRQDYDSGHTRAAWWGVTR